jgi:hypothetical protein
MLDDDNVLFHFDVFRTDDVEQERGNLFDIFDVFGIHQVNLDIILVFNVNYRFLPYMLGLIKRRRDIENP